jgi:Flp pilus assembly protein TadG
MERVVVSDPHHQVMRDRRRGTSKIDNHCPVVVMPLLRDARGAISVEMLFFILIFVVAFFGAVEMAREISVKHALDVGTYRATRYLSIVPSDQSTARNMIQTELDSNVLGGAGAVQMIVNMPTESFQAIFSVTAHVNYQPVVPLMVFAPKVLSVSHSQSIEAYP